MFLILAYKTFWGIMVTMHIYIWTTCLSHFSSIPSSYSHSPRETVEDYLRSHGAQRDRTTVCLLQNVSVLILFHALRFLSTTSLWLVASCFSEFRLAGPWNIFLFIFLFLCSGFLLKNKLLSGCFSFSFLLSLKTKRIWLKVGDLLWIFK